VEGWRWKNRPHLGEWEQAVARGQLPAAELEQLGPDQRRGEWVMLRLRLDEGVGFDAYAARWGRDARADYAGELAQLTKLGLIEVTPERFTLSDAGLAVADAVAGEFLRV
jgi:coproporphyrinogen III oxidase-like Fe-S oxidoreductase